MIGYNLDVEGNISPEDLAKAMTILGELIINKIKDNIRLMELIDEGRLLQGWLARWDGQNLHIDNTQKYMVYLEFGTYGYWNIYGLKGFPEKPLKKKRDMTKAEKEAEPKGMQPFAMQRRVIYNHKIMNGLISQAFSSIS